MKIVNYVTHIHFKGIPFLEGAMVEICLSSMHPTTLEILKEIRIIGLTLLPDVTEICYQVNVIYQISLI